MSLATFALALALGPLGGCIDTDAAVFVDPSISAPEATINSGALGSTLSGTLRLSLHLGPRASGSSRVTALSFTIQSADQKRTLLEPLPVVSPAELSFSLDPDSDADIVIRFDTEKKPLAAATRDALCGAGTVRVTGVLDDSLKGGSTPVTSEPFTITGC